MHQPRFFGAVLLGVRPKPFDNEEIECYIKIKTYRAEFFIMIIRDITVNYECRKGFRCLRKNGLPEKNLFVLFKTPAYVSADVISLHPYNRHNKPKDVFEAETVELMDYIETFGKPFLITECCWGAPTEDERLPYLESELETFSKLGVGYIVQGLFTSPVADLHPIEESHMTEGLYMAFLDRNLNVRKHHDIFNKF